MPGLVWALFIRKRDKSHRTRDWFLPFVARRRRGHQLLLLPRVGALLRHARRRRQRQRLPCREDSVGRVRGLRRGGVKFLSVNPQMHQAFFIHSKGWAAVAPVAPTVVSPLRDNFKCVSSNISRCGRNIAQNRKFRISRSNRI